MTRAQLSALVAGRATGAANRIAQERALWNAIINETCKLFQVIEIDVNLTLHPTFITDNFTGTGLGKNDYEGFAICNGLNGTQNRAGRAAIGYGFGYTGIGGLIGTADSVVVSHSHGTIPNTNIAWGSGDSIVRGRADAEPEGVGESINVTIQSTGVSGVGKNIPPSIITLMVQRIA